MGTKLWEMEYYEKTKSLKVPWPQVKGRMKGEKPNDLCPSILSYATKNGFGSKSWWCQVTGE